MTDATTTLTLTAGMNCYPSLRKGKSVNFGESDGLWVIFYAHCGAAEQFIKHIATRRAADK